MLQRRVAAKIRVREEEVSGFVVIQASFQEPPVACRNAIELSVSVGIDRPFATTHHEPVIGIPVIPCVEEHFIVVT
ncbi:hypothetical protein [Rosistilla ulvae]|uniref:hypothetical protein n=1 Tax=Rosistilla ulvae TaxID=1930277 RepID=UPI0011A81AA5|nr:hypothetical protein [Rosistilla ulvae]